MTFGVKLGLNFPDITENVLKRVMDTPEELGLFDVSRVLYFVSWHQIMDETLEASLMDKLGQRMAYLLFQYEVSSSSGGEEIKVEDVVHLLSGLYDLAAAGHLLRDPIQKVLRAVDGIPLEAVTECVNQNELAKNIAEAILIAISPPKKTKCCDSSGVSSSKLPEAKRLLKYLSKLAGTFKVLDDTRLGEPPLRADMFKALMLLNQRRIPVEAWSAKSSLHRLKHTYMRDVINMKVKKITSKIPPPP